MNDPGLSYTSIALGIAAYVVVSNTLWLLLGSRFLQFLPGVGMEGWRGTLKIAVFIVVLVVSLMEFLLKRIILFDRGVFLKVLMSKNIEYAYRFRKLLSRN